MHTISNIRLLDFLFLNIWNTVLNYMCNRVHAYIVLGQIWPHACKIITLYVFRSRLLGFAFVKISKLPLVLVVYVWHDGRLGAICALPAHIWLDLYCIVKYGILWALSSNSELSASIVKTRNTRCQTWRKQPKALFHSL
jgi:hypothetical protein